MAKAQYSIVETEKIIVTKEKVVDMQLSDDEAKTLAVILRLVGGDRKKTARKHSQAILDALTQLGYNYEYPQTSTSGSIYFKD